MVRTFPMVQLLILAMLLEHHLAILDINQTVTK